MPNVLSRERGADALYTPPLAEGAAGWRKPLVHASVGCPPYNRQLACRRLIVPSAYLGRRRLQGGVCRMVSIRNDRLRARDEIILGIPMGPVGIGITRLVYWEWEWNGNG